MDCIGTESMTATETEAPLATFDEVKIGDYVLFRAPWSRQYVAGKVAGKKQRQFLCWESKKLLLRWGVHVVDMGYSYNKLTWRRWRHVVNVYRDFDK